MHPVATAPIMRTAPAYGPIVEKPRHETIDGEVCNTGSGQPVICCRGGIGCDIDHPRPARPRREWTRDELMEALAQVARRELVHDEEFAEYIGLPVGAQWQRVETITRRQVRCNCGAENTAWDVEMTMLAGGNAGQRAFLSYYGCTNCGVGHSTNARPGVGYR